jgi:hypothetical protein
MVSITSHHTRSSVLPRSKPRVFWQIVVPILVAIGCPAVRALWVKYGTELIRRYEEVRRAVVDYAASRRETNRSANQGRNAPLSASNDNAALGAVRCRSCLGGLLDHYACDAA